MLRPKKSSLVPLVHEKQASQRLCLASGDSTACADYKINIYEHTNSV